MPPPPAFDAAQAAWMQSGAVSVTVAAADPDGRPELSLSFGCRISADRRRVTVFLGAVTGARLIAVLRERAAIAVVVTESSIARSIQLKGFDATFGALETGDQERLREHVEALAATWARAGQPLEWTRTLIDPDAEDVLAVTFTPHVAFDQTPGPRAGQALKGDS